MERTICPPHVPLSDYCAKTILERHTESLPDLTGIVILTPNATSGRALRSDLLRQAEQQGIQGLLLPSILPLPLWARQHSQFSGTENHLSDILELVSTLRRHEVLQALGLADSWSVARELMNLFEQLWLNETALPPDPGELKLRLQKAYGIADDPPKQLGMEADIIHLLWKAWNEGQNEALSSGKFYREALLRLTPPDGIEAIYVCGHDKLSVVETRALERLSEKVPVSMFTRPQTLIPLETEGSTETVSLSLSSYATVLQETFATRAAMPERARACRERYPDSPLAGRLRTFVAEQAEPHARGIDIQIRRWLLAGHRNIGLVTEDRKLARRVRALSERAGIQIQDYAGWALSTTSAASVVLRWIECVDQDFHYLAFLDVLKSPFVRLIGQHGYRDQVGAFEQKLHRLNVHSGLENYRRIADGNPAWLDMLGEIEKAAKPLLGLKDQVDGGAYLGALLESLEHLNCRACLAADDVGKKILSELEKARFQLACNETLLPKSQWVTLLRQILERQNYRPKSTQNAVSLINLNQAHLVHFDCLIVAGMDSRHYPGMDSSFLVFNDSVRADLGLPTSAALRALDLQRFLSLIQSSGQVLLTYQKTDQDEPLLPSIWWTQIDVFHRLVYKTPLEDSSLATLSLHPDAWVRPFDLQSRKPSFSSMPSPATLPELLPGRISASGHQALVDCPYRFYVRDMLRIRETDVVSEEMDSLEFGSYVHRCLEAFHTDISDTPGPWKSPIGENEASAIGLLQKIGQHFMDRLTPNPSNIVFKERWEAIARRYVRLQRSLEDQQIFLESEQRAEQEIDGGLKLFGIIDRVDESADGDRIVIDYKTGSKKISTTEILNGEQVQLSTYALLMSAISRVEYWWLSQEPQKDIPLTSLEGEQLEIISQKVGDRLRGMFQSLNEHAEMPANGNAATCSYCYAQGVCRKDMETEASA